MKRLPEPPKSGQPRTIHRNRFQHLYRVPLDYGTFRKQLFVTDYGCRVGMVAVWQSRILLIREYRYLIKGYSWEIPGGASEAGERLDRAAVRECREETGITCVKPKLLVMYHPGLDTVCNPTRIYVTTTFRGDTNTRPGDKSVAWAEWVPFLRCLRMIKSGNIVDALSIIGLQTLALNHTELV